MRFAGNLIVSCREMAKAETVSFSVRAVVEARVEVNYGFNERRRMLVFLVRKCLVE